MAEALPPLQPDTHEAQAARVADHCERHPGADFTAAELTTACELGCASKVLSAMVRKLGYGLRKGWRTVRCAAGTRTRRVRTYALLHRPQGAQRDLFEDT